MAHLWLLWLLISILALCTPADAGAPRKLLAQQHLTLAGKAIVISYDEKGKESRYLAVHTANGRRVQVQVADASHMAGIVTGMHIEVTGQWAQPAAAAARGGLAVASASGLAAPALSTFAATTISASGAPFAAPKITTAAAGSGAVAGGLAAAAAARPAAAAITRSTNQVVAADISTLVVPIAAVDPATGAYCAGTSAPKASLGAVRKAVFAESNPNGISVGSTFSKCSFGKSKLTAANSKITNVVKLGCSGTTNGAAWTFAKCDFQDFNGYADAADEQLRAQGIDLSKYKHRVYLIPPNACTFVGLGYMGCDGTFDCRVWIGSEFWASPQAIAHELGHNLYMAHAGSVVNGVKDSYADESCTMGYCCMDRCPNTPHAWQLGWISVQQLDGSSLKAGQTVNVTLNSQAASARSGVRISPSWVVGQAPIFLGYRTRAAGDAGMDVSMASKVHVYTANITNTFDPQVTTWKAGLATVGSAWTSPETGLVVRLRSIRGSSAVVTVCRKGGAETLASCQAGVDNDCNGLAGAKDPKCAVLLKKVKRTPA